MINFLFRIFSTDKVEYDYEFRSDFRQKAYRLCLSCDSVQGHISPLHGDSHTLEIAGIRSLINTK